MIFTNVLYYQTAPLFVKAYFRAFIGAVYDVDAVMLGDTG